MWSLHGKLDAGKEGRDQPAFWSCTSGAEAPSHTLVVFGRVRTGTVGPSIPAPPPSENLFCPVSLGPYPAALRVCSWLRVLGSLLAVLGGPEGGLHAWQCPYPLYYHSVSSGVSFVNSVYWFIFILFDSYCSMPRATRCWPQTQGFKPHPSSCSSMFCPCIAGGDGISRSLAFCFWLISTNPKWFLFLFLHVATTYSIFLVLWGGREKVFYCNTYKPPLLHSISMDMLFVDHLSSLQLGQMKFFVKLFSCSSSIHPVVVMLKHRCRVWEFTSGDPLKKGLRFYFLYLLHFLSLRAPFAPLTSYPTPAV